MISSLLTLVCNMWFLLLFLVKFYNKKMAKLPFYLTISPLIKPQVAKERCYNLIVYLKMKSLLLMN